MIYAFLFGFIFALGLILQVGPQNVFVLQQGAQQKHFPSLILVVCLASLCDTLLIVLAIAGVSASVLHFPWVKYTLLIAGILFLSVYAARAWRQVSNLHVDIKQRSIAKLIIFTLSVSLLNPGSLIDTLVTIGSASTTFVGASKIAFMLGCIITSWAWFIFLAAAGKWLLKFSWFTRNINKITAVVMALAALYLLGYLIIALVGH